MAKEKQQKNANGEILQDRPKFSRNEPKLHKDIDWSAMTNKEREESSRLSDRNLVGQHAKAMKERGETPYYMKEASKEEMEKTTPYSPTTGQPFYGWLEQKMRMHQQLNGFKEAKYVDIDQAHFNRLKLNPLTDEKGETLKHSGTGKDLYPIGVKFAYYEEYEKVPKRDKDGNVIYKKDQNGNEISWTNSKGELQKTPETIMVKLDQPRLVTKTYYNVEQLDNSNQKYKDKPLDLSKKHEVQRKNEELGREVQSNLSQFKLLGLTQKNLEKHMDASANGKDFEPITLSQNREHSLAPTQKFVPKKQENQPLGHGF